ncbi:dienelactone hydrolase family protein [Chryseobacterium sp. A301]
MKLTFFSALLFASIALVSCQKKTDSKVLEPEVSSDSVTVEQAQLHTKVLEYDANGISHKGYVAYDSTRAGSLPIVLVIPEWWGLNDYAKGRADQLASLGYYAVALDYYGNGKAVQTPEEAQKEATVFYQDPSKGQAIYQAVKATLAKDSKADGSKIAVMGYCFGGAQALNLGRQNQELKGVVSFHGNLQTGVKPTNSKVKYLVLNGEADNFVPAEEIAAFKKEMDSAKIDYKFVNYPGAVHAFTNPASTEVGKKFDMNIAYNKEADEKSWEEMKAFFSSIFQ